MGQPSLAFGTAAQGASTSHGREVVGEWEPCDQDGPEAVNAKIDGRAWADGLLWSDISPESSLTTRTTKGRHADNLRSHAYGDGGIAPRRRL